MIFIWVKFWFISILKGGRFTFLGCLYSNVKFFPDNSDDRAVGRPVSSTGGPYYGGDSYGPWSTGHGGSEHGPWGSHGYGSGFYVSNNPSRSPPPLFQPNNHYSGNHYGSGGAKHYHSELLFWLIYVLPIFLLI